MEFVMDLDMLIIVVYVMLLMQMIASRIVLMSGVVMQLI